MRIREKFEKIGYFWLPDSPDVKVPGTLRIEDGGKIELETMGLLDESTPGQSKDRNIGQIIDDIEDEGKVSLEGQFYKNKAWASGGSITRSLIHIKTAFCGWAFDENDKAKFNFIEFSVEGMDEWVNMSEIKVDTLSKTKNISYTPQEDVEIYDSDIFTISIARRYIFGSPSRYEAKIAEKVYFRLTMKEEAPLKDFTDIIYYIVNLLCFATGKVVTLDFVQGFSSLAEEVYEGTYNPISIKIFYQSLPFSNKKPNIYPHRMLLPYSLIQNRLQHVIDKWIEAYTLFGPALDLYFSATGGGHRYIDGRFLTMVQAIEVFHRRTSDETLMEESEYQDLVDKILAGCPENRKNWLKEKLTYGNELTLRQRIKDIFSPLKQWIGEKSMTKQLIGDIVSTRNYLTHYTSTSRNMPITSDRMLRIFQKMEAVFQLQLLMYLGFDFSDIEEILKRSHDLKYKLNN